MEAQLKRELEEKVRSGERLTRADGIALFESDDLAWLGGLAQHARAAKNADAVHFVSARQLPLPSVCPGDCPTRPAGTPVEDGTERQAERTAQLTRLAGAMAEAGVTELRLSVGPTAGCGRWHYQSLLDGLRALRRATPETVSLHAFTAADIRRLETVTSRTADELLDELIDAGLNSLVEEHRSHRPEPAGHPTAAGPDTTTADAGEPAHPNELDELDELDALEQWARVHRLAHDRGLRTPGTVLYGYGEDPARRVDRLLRLRELQGETGGFEVVTPLRYDPALTPSARPAGDAGAESAGSPALATGAEVLKTFAVSRLLLDNVPHLRACWVAHGQQTAQLALVHGADDLDGPLLDGPLLDSATDSQSTDGHGAVDASAAEAHLTPGLAPSPNALTREDLLTLVTDAGFHPVERGPRYGALRTYPGPDPDRRESPQPMRV